MIPFIFVSCANLSQSKVTRTPAQVRLNANCKAQLARFQYSPFLEEIENFKKLKSDIDELSDDQQVKHINNITADKLTQHLQGAYKDLGFDLEVKIQNQKDLHKLQETLYYIKTKKSFDDKSIYKIMSIFHRAIYNDSRLNRLPIIGKIYRRYKTLPSQELERILVKRSLEMGIEDFLKTILPRTEANSIFQTNRFLKKHYNKTTLSLAAAINIPFMTFSPIPIYLPRLGLKDYNTEYIDEILASLKKDGWNKTQEKLQRLYGKSANAQRYYDYLKIAYNSTIPSLIIIYVLYEYYFTDEGVIREQMKEAIFKGLESRTHEQMAEDMANKLTFDSDEKRAQFIDLYLQQLEIAAQKVEEDFE